MKIIDVQDIFKDIFITVGIKGVFIEDTKGISLDNITVVKIKKNTTFIVDDIDIIQREIGVHYLQDNKITRAIVSFKDIINRTVISSDFNKKVDTIDLNVTCKQILDFQTVLMIFVPLIAFLIGVII